MAALLSYHSQFINSLRSQFKVFLLPSRKPASENLQDYCHYLLPASAASASKLNRIRHSQARFVPYLASLLAANSIKIAVSLVGIELLFMEKFVEKNAVNPCDVLFGDISIPHLSKRSFHFVISPAIQKVLNELYILVVARKYRFKQLVSSAEAVIGAIIGPIDY